MISRAHMRRQLRANGGITNLRQGYGLGDFVRKLIPNELADLASKAAPFVAPFNPLAAGIMRGVGRYDKRGSLKDALKQGVLTYAGGKGARYLGGVDKTLMPGQGSRGFDFTMDKFKEGPLGNITKDFREGMKDSTKRVKDAAKSVNRPTMDDIANKDSIFKKAGKFYDDLNPVVKGQLITGGGTFIATLVSEALKDEPEQQPGETMEEYNARRKQKVSSYLRTYLSNTRPTASTEEIDTLVERYTSEYNQGGRVGYQTGGISMNRSLAENVRRNNAERTLNQMARNYDFSGLSTLGLNAKNYDSTPGPMRGIPAVKGMREKMIQDIMNRNQPYSLTPPKPPKPTDPLTGMPETMMLPNMTGTSMRSLAEMNAIRDRVLAAQQEQRKPSFQERMGGESWDMLSDNDQYRIAMEYPGETPPRRNSNFVPSFSSGGRVGFSQGSDLKIKLKQIGYEDTLLDRMSLKELRKLLDSEKGTFTDQGTYREPGNMGGLMRLNYMIGGEAKQLEAGAPPIMYSGNMDPNQKTGLPSIPGPIQMAEDGPEFDMRENGGFQPLGRQEGKDDVPAMLAKNEFVMTADAVRAAGGGSIEKGAQKMYDTMKKLESRVS